MKSARIHKSRFTNCSLLLSTRKVLLIRGLNGSWDTYSFRGIPADFAGAIDVINNLLKKRKPEIEIAHLKFVIVNWS